MKTVKSEIYKRELVYERLFYRSPFCIVTMVARIKGSITKDQLRSALLMLQSRHRLINCSIKAEEDGTAYFLSDRVLEPVIKEYKVQGDDSYKQNIIEELKKAVDLDKGPLIRYLLLVNGISTDLIIICHHTICDGLSLVYLLRDIMLYISKPDRTAAVEAYPPSLTKEIVPGSSAESFIARLAFGSVNREWKKSKRVFAVADYKRLWANFWQNEKPDIIVKTLDSNNTTRLLERCREEKVTVNSAVCSAFINAQSEVQGNHEACRNKISMAVNIRRRTTINPGEIMGLYASGLKLDVKNKEKNFWNGVRLLNNNAVAQLKNDKKVFQMTLFNMIDASLMDAMYFHLYDEFENRAALKLTKLLGYHEKSVGLGFTNLGKLEIQKDYGPYEIYDILFIPPTAPNVEKIIGVCTFEGRINFTLPYLYSMIDSKTVVAVMDRAIEILIGSCK